MQSVAVVLYILVLLLQLQLQSSQAVWVVSLASAAAATSSAAAAPDSHLITRLRCCRLPLLLGAAGMLVPSALGLAALAQHGCGACKRWEAIISAAVSELLLSKVRETLRDVSRDLMVCVRVITACASTRGSLVRISCCR